ncbi:MAG: sirohydrochlorin chelatase [Kutzneria sp.]|nr:sirohydrochlorin chelatase [Kutzneria sp.]MBV9846065.1 sirohydrochlorin chelatase [Kutzneria sp.]
MSGIPLLAVGHGSRDPRSATVIGELLAVVRMLRPDLDVRAAFLDLSVPRLADVLGAIHAEGYHEVVVVPLLLGSAYHAKVDVPNAIAEATAPHLRVHLADVLGPDPRLASAALRRLRVAGASPDDPNLGVVLAAAGSSHAPANDLVSAAARRLGTGTTWAGVMPAFATTASHPAAANHTVATAISALRAAGARRIAVGSWFLAPGLLSDRVARQALAAADGIASTVPLIAAPLGADLDVARLVLDRYAEAAAGGRVPRSA